MSVHLDGIIGSLSFSTPEEVTKKKMILESVNGAAYTLKSKAKQESSYLEKEEAIYLCVLTALSQKQAVLSEIKQRKASVGSDDLQILNRLETNIGKIGEKDGGESPDNKSDIEDSPTSSRASSSPLIKETKDGSPTPTANSKKLSNEAAEQIAADFRKAATRNGISKFA